MSGSVKDVEIQTLLSEESEAAAVTSSAPRLWKKTAVLLVAALTAFAALALRHSITKPASGQLDTAAVVQENIDIDPSAVWEQMKGAVKIDQLKAMLNKGGLDGDTKKKLEEQLKVLQEAFPGADKIKDQFADSWKQVEQGVVVDELKGSVEDAKKMGSEKLPELQAKLEQATKGVDMGSIQQQAATHWQSVQSQLPDMNGLQSALSSHGAAAKEAFDSLMENNDFSALKGSVKDVASDAWGQVQGWMR